MKKQNIWNSSPCSQPSRLCLIFDPMLLLSCLERAFTLVMLFFTKHLETLFNGIENLLL